MLPDWEVFMDGPRRRIQLVVASIYFCGALCHFLSRRNVGEGAIWYRVTMVTGGIGKIKDFIESRLELCYDTAYSQNTHAHAHTHTHTHTRITQVRLLV